MAAIVLSPAIPPTPSTLSSAELAKVLDSKDTTFDFYYFKLHTHGATTRAILAYVDAQWKNTYASDWVTEKPRTRYGTLPVLYEISADGSKVIEHAEALNIELRLARRFDLLGSNSAEESAITGAFSNTRALMHRFEDAYFVRKQFRDEEHDKFINEKLLQWIRTHEKILSENGSNGHYVGNQVSLADIKTTVAIEQLLNESYTFKGFEDIKLYINASASPNLWKIRETVLGKKSYRSWLESEAYKTIT
ncbi:hypothetical protein BGW38_009313, partial [Lunasporangiospora selenospora]